MRYCCHGLSQTRHRHLVIAQLIMHCDKKFMVSRWNQWIIFRIWWSVMMLIFYEWKCISDPNMQRRLIVILVNRSTVSSCNEWVPTGFYINAPNWLYWNLEYITSMTMQLLGYLGGLTIDSEGSHSYSSYTRPGSIGFGLFGFVLTNIWI